MQSESMSQLAQPATGVLTQVASSQVSTVQGSSSSQAESLAHRSSHTSSECSFLCLPPQAELLSMSAGIGCGSGRGNKTGAGDKTGGALAIGVAAGIFTVGLWSESPYAHFYFFNAAGISAVAEA